jgi:hypothetical protein
MLMRHGLLPSRTLAATVALVATSLLALSASATTLLGASMGWTVEETGQTGSLNLLGLATCNSTDVGGDCSLNNFTPGHGLYTVNSWTSAWDSDPFVTNNVNVTNNTAGTLIFDVTVTSPVVLTGPLTAMSGSVGITLTNTTGTALLDNSVAAAIYSALIDGSSVRTLFDPPYSLTCTPPFCSTSDSDDFGIFPNPPEIGPQANATIGIRLRFQLSAGDSAGITSVFNIEAVPEPGTAALLALGLVGLVVRRRLAQRR